MKLQFLSFDAIFAIVIFTFAVSLLAFIWYTINSQISVASGTNYENMQLQLESLSERILGTGYPVGWYSKIDASNGQTWSNISIGIGTGIPGQISSAKLATFASMANGNYLATKQLVGVSFDYYIVISSANYHLAIGKVPIRLSGGSLPGVTQQVTTKSVTVNGQPATMQLYVWTNSSFGIG